MKKLCSLVIGMLSILLLSGPMASAANGITVRGQFEGAYAKNVYRFVTPEGQEISAMMENGGKIMSYTPFQASGYIAHNQAQQSILIIQKVAYEDRLPNQPIVSYRKDVEDSSSKIMTRKPSKVEITRDAGYFQGPVKSDLNNWYQVNPGALRIDQLDGYQVAWNLSGIPMGTKICTVGRLISSAEGGLMNFRTAQGTNILVDLNGAVVPMGQRVTILGIISSPSVLMIQFVHSIGSE